MVKNTTGGSRHKGQARDRGLAISTDFKITSELEIQAYVEKIIGNGRLLVNSIDGKHTGLICAIRGKFRGRNKSRNRISTNSIVIIGLREWEQPTYKTCDLLSVSTQTFTPPDNDNDNDNDIQHDILFSNNNNDDNHNLLLQNNLQNYNHQHADNHNHNHNHNDIDFDDI
jgi:translation initiation factor IF-1